MLWKDYCCILQLMSSRVSRRRDGPDRILSLEQFAIISLSWKRCDTCTMPKTQDTDQRRLLRLPENLFFRTSMLNFLMGKRAWYIQLRKLDDDHILVRFGTEAEEMYQPGALDHPEARVLTRVGRESRP